ncbi:MAG: carbohydrate-binding protein [Prevotellaceae bacterium]|nr:carbohydrate-binding protein [Candidatus Minthosoma equi]
MFKQSLLILSCLFALAADAQDKPTMGWSSWNTFGINISETTIRNQAMALRSKGLLQVGYDHINIDDGYFGGRDKSTGELKIHKTRFPNGLKPVVDYIHRMGEKAGIYSDGGRNTCGNYHGGDTIAHDVGLYGYDQRDCDFFFKDMGFDFIKVDFCGGVDYHNSQKLNLDAETRYKEIAKAIENTGRTDVRLNVCRWDYPGNWVHDIATSWRTTGDINASWGSIKDIIQQNLYLSAYCYDGHYNDMDMLEVGRGIGKEEDKTHFGMWCIMASPLLIGCNLETLDAVTLTLLKNKDLIALNQDVLCIQAYVVQHKGDTYVLAKDIENLNGNVRAVALYNPSDAAVDMSIKFADVDLGGVVKVRDLFARKELEDMTESLSVNVPAHGTRIYRLEAEKRYERMIYEGETAYLSEYQEIFNNQARQTAIYESNSSASGGMVAGWLGQKATNDLQWRNVFSNEGGEYSLNIKYVSGESRNMTLSVNGKDIKTISCNSGSWSTVGTKTVKVVLEPGENVVRLYTKSGWMPSIDCMTVQKIGTTDRTVITAIESVPASQAATLHGKSNTFYDLSGREVANPQKGLFINNNKKIFIK